MAKKRKGELVVKLQQVNKILSGVFIFFFLKQESRWQTASSVHLGSAPNTNSH